MKKSGGASRDVGAPPKVVPKTAPRSWPAPVGLVDLADDPDAVVVLLADRSVDGVVGWLEFFAGARVRVISDEAKADWPLEQFGARHHAGQTPDQLNARLRTIGRIDVIVDLQPGTVTQRRDTFHRLFLYLRPGGRYVVDCSGADSVIGSVGFAEWVAMLLRSTDPSATNVSARDREFGQSVRSVRVSADLLMIEKEQRHYVKLRDAEAVQVLQQREPDVTAEVLASRPAGKLLCRAEIVSHLSSIPIPALDNVLSYPELQTRRYQGRFAVVSNALVHTEQTVLPESFRHHLDPPLRNPRLTSISATFGRISASLRPHQSLPGSFYHLDAENSGHFGHLMTEVISRLWGWDVAKAADPELKVLFRIRFPGERIPGLEQTLFQAYGIATEDIVWIDAPVWVETLVGATPMWHNQPPHYVHPGLVDVWDRLGNALIDEDAPSHRWLFVSRRDLLSNRACRNTRAVESFFAERGFSVIYPEDWSLSEQAGMFAHAEVIAGFGGSALFNVMFARKLKTLIVLNHEAYTARNEHLFTALMDVTVHYFWSTPDVQHPVGGWNQKAYYSGWEFDFERNAIDLDAVLADL